LTDLQRQLAAAQRARSILAATAHAISCMNEVLRLDTERNKVEWSLVDVNLVLFDGRRFHTTMAASLRFAAFAFPQPPEISYSLRTAMLNKLLEYAPTASSLQPGQPRDVDELLQWMAIELAGDCCKLLESFIRLLVETLHRRGFDLDRRSPDGRTLLTAYAAANQNDHTIAVEWLLMRLGADASKAGSDGRNPLFIWINQESCALVESMLVDSSKVRYPGLKQYVDLWQRDAEGRTLLECMQAKQHRFGPIIGVLRELQQFWIFDERPLVQSLLTESTPLIVDVARMVLDYVDGGGAKAK